MENPYCVFCGDAVVDGSIVTCPSCGLRGCNSCAAEGHNACPDCSVQMQRDDMQQPEPSAEASGSAKTGDDADSWDASDTDGKQGDATGKPDPQSSHGDNQRVDTEGRFDVHHVDPDRWRRDFTLGKPQAGPAIVFAGVTSASALVLAAVTLTIMFSVGLLDPAILRAVVDFIHPPVPEIVGVWEGEFGDESAMLWIRDQDGRSFHGTLKRNTAAGMFTTGISGSIDPEGMIVFTEDKLVGTAPTGRSIHCVAHGKLKGVSDGEVSTSSDGTFGDYMEGNSTVGDKTFNWRYELDGGPYIEFRDRAIAQVDPLRFYEAGPDYLPEPDRHYATSFSQGSARFIKWNIRIQFPALTTNTVVPTKAELFGPDRSRLVAFTGQRTLMPGSTSMELAWQYGKPSSGGWKPGEYRVVVHVDHQEAAQGQFTLR